MEAPQPQQQPQQQPHQPPPRQPQVQPQLQPHQADNNGANDSTTTQGGRLTAEDLCRLSAEELEWAWALKSAVEAEDDLRPLSDFEYVHQALYALGDTEVAVRRVRRLQYFRQEYRIADNAEEGVCLINGFMDKHPGFLLSVDLDDTYGDFVMVYDYAKRRPAALKTDNDWRDHLGGMYYLCHATQNNIHACREGIVHVCECEGMGWENFSSDVVRRNFSDLFENYPLRHKEISMLRTPTVGNILFSFMKRLLRADAVQRSRLGCDFHGYDGRLDEIFAIPTREAAQEQLLVKLYGYLVIRYQMEQTFVLPDLEDFEEDEDDDEEDEEADDEDDTGDAEDNAVALANNEEI